MALNDVIAGLTAGRNGPTRARADDSVDEDEVMEDDQESSEGEPTEVDGEETDTDEEAGEEPEGAEASGSYAEGVAAGRVQATRRIQAILNAPSAARQPGQAAHLAFDTDMSSEQAIGVLDAAQPSASGGSLGSRMAGEVIDPVSPGASTGQPKSDYEKGRAAGAKVAAMKAHSRTKKEG